MRLPTSFALQYQVERAVADRLQSIAGTRLQTQVCAPEGWLFADRIKNAESAFSKLLFGTLGDLSAMKDLYAATIVVPTRAELADAIARVSDEFPGSDVQVRTTGDPTRFVYDDIHIIAQLGAHASGLGAALAERRFEVQVRTGLQFAWWRATHDAVYKGRRSRRLIRISSQTRASLELLDLVLADLRHSADQLQPSELDPADIRRERVEGLLSRWDPARHPEDVTRFCLSVQEILDAANLDARACGELLDAVSGRRLVRQVDIAPFQAVVGAVAEAKGLSFLEHLEISRRILLTDELRVACPVLVGAPARRIARVASPATGTTIASLGESGSTRP